MAIEVVRKTELDQDVIDLVTELSEEMNRHYSQCQQHGLKIDQIMRPQIAFYVAYEEGEPAACGGVDLQYKWGELKRMYARPDFPWEGAAQAILDALFEAAKSAGKDTVRLETGILSEGRDPIL
ncbi:MAG: GNAT family N-acetyltransferase [Fimbriimonadaceae bacterium]